MGEIKHSIRRVAVVMSKTVAIITVKIYIYDEYSMSLLSVAHSKHTAVSNLGVANMFNVHCSVW